MLLALLLTRLCKRGSRAAKRHQSDDGANGEYRSKDQLREHLLSPMGFDCANDGVHVDNTISMRIRTLAKSN